MRTRVTPLDAIFDSHIPNDVVKRITAYTEDPLVALTEALGRAIDSLVKARESLDRLFAVTEEKHRYAGDET